MVDPDAKVEKHSHKKDDENGEDMGRHFVARVLDLSCGGLKALYPLSTESMYVLKESQELDLSFSMLGIQYSASTEIIEVKENAKARKGLLRVKFKGMTKESKKRLERYITHKLTEEKERIFKKILESQKSERKIINPKTLREEMTGEELEGLMWRKKGDIFLVQVDKLTKGKKAFYIYLPKRGTKNIYIKKDWDESDK